MIVPASDIDAAVDALRRGEVIGIPTDTVYGLAALEEDALFEIKQRPRHVEIPVLVADEAQMAELGVDLPSEAKRLMARFWPGALTIVVRRGGGTVGVRSPDHEVPIALCRAVGPLKTTSANRHGEPTATTAAHIEELFAGSILVLDGGTCEGSPSTVVDCTGDAVKLLREGRIPWDEIVS